MDDPVKWCKEDIVKMRGFIKFLEVGGIIGKNKKSCDMNVYIKYFQGRITEAERRIANYDKKSK